SGRPIPSVGSSGEIRTAADDFDASDFELNPSSVIDALEQPDAGSDFELTALDASDEFDSMPGPRPSDSDVTGAEPSSSGINLGRPSDSGINLQSVGFLDDADSIELAPLDEDDAPPPKTKAAAPPPGKPRPDLAATPLPTKGQKDIFEDTDFEVDVLDSDSEDRTVQLEAASDFDLDEADTGSEVFAIDEDEVDQNAATALGPAVAAVDDDEAVAEVDEEEDADLGADWDEDEDAAPAAAARSAPAPVLSAPGPGAEWGGLWVGLLGVATLFTLLLTFVTMDVVRNLYEYRGSNPVSSGLVQTIAGLFGG
ncbi:MAG TPA: DNA-binding protein, partial [Isosphaeraceae bacterium]